MRPLTTMVLPKNSGFQIGGTSVVGNVGTRRTSSKNCAARRVEQRAVRVERAVLDGQRDLVVAGARRIAERGRRSGQHAARAGRTAPPRSR